MGDPMPRLRQLELRAGAGQSAVTGSAVSGDWLISRSRAVSRRSVAQSAGGTAIGRARCSASYRLIRCLAGSATTAASKLPGTVLGTECCCVCMVHARVSTLSALCRRQMRGGARGRGGLRMGRGGYKMKSFVPRLPFDIYLCEAAFQRVKPVADEVAFQQVSASLISVA